MVEGLFAFNDVSWLTAVSISGNWYINGQAGSGWELFGRVDIVNTNDNLKGSAHRRFLIGGGHRFAAAKRLRVAASVQFIDADSAKAAYDEWIKTPFEGGRHERRVRKITDYENR